MDKRLTPEWRRQRNRILIISYDLVRKLPDDVSKHFDFVIADESHALKSPTAQRTQAVAPLVKRASRAVLITGTPAMSRPIELYSQLDMLTRGQLGALSSFGKRYCVPTPSVHGYETDYKGSANEAELHAVLEVVGMIRRLKRDVLADLPPKRRMRVPILTDPACTRDLEAVKRAMRDVNRDGSLCPDEADRRRQLLLNQFYGVSGDAKAQPAAAHINDLLEKGAKLLVFAHHTAVLDAIEAACLKGPQGRRGIRIDGATPPAARQAAVNTFQGDPQCRVALLSITAAGVGITLTAAEVVVFAELVWTPAQLIQAEDRAHRLGQTGSLEVHYLHAPGSIDDIMWPNVRTKLNVVGSTLDGNLTGTATGLDIGQFCSWAPPPEPEGDTATAAGSSVPALAGHSPAAGTPGGSQRHSQDALQQPDLMAGSPDTQRRSFQLPMQPGSLHSPPTSSQPWGSPGSSSRPAGLSDIDVTPVDSDDEVCPGDTLQPGAIGGATAGQLCSGMGTNAQQQQQQQQQQQLSQIDLTPLDDSDDDVRPGDSWVPEAGSGGVAGGSQQEPASQQSVRTALNERAASGRADLQETAALPEHDGAAAPQDRVGQKRRRRQPRKVDFVDLT